MKKDFFLSSEYSGTHLTDFLIWKSFLFTEKFSGKISERFLFFVSNMEKNSSKTHTHLNQWL